MTSPLKKMSLSYELASPVTGRTIDSIALSSKIEVLRRLEALVNRARPLQQAEVLAFLDRLHDQVQAHQDALIETTILETGFIRSDSHDIIAGALEYLRDFRAHAESQSSHPRLVPHSYSQPNSRSMRITHRPYDWIAAMVPQNASFALGITILASALYAGSRVLLRPSLQCGSSGNLLASMVERSGPPEGSVLIVNCLADDFLEACYDSSHVELIHYIGSNRHAMRVLTDTLAARKNCLLDGQGNGMLYVDGSFPLDEAARLIVSGATRFNGETCTSVNGVLVEEGSFAPLRDALVQAFKRLAVGDPGDPRVQVGPLFSAAHAETLEANLRAGGEHRVLCGGSANGAYIEPAIVEGVKPADLLVREGVFGPALWISPIREHELMGWLRANAFPLSDTLLSTRADLMESFTLGSRAPRVCVNEDPSIESMFEPWGGYPPSGLNPVSIWIDKYRQTYQLDAAAAVLELRAA